MAAGFVAETQQHTHTPHRHWTYDNDDQFRLEIGVFLAEAVREGVPAVLIADTTEDVHRWVPDSSVREQALRTGSIRVRPVNEVYVPDGAFRPERALERLECEVDSVRLDPDAAVYVAGDMSWSARGIPGSSRLLEFEMFADRALGERNAVGLCTYDRRRFDDRLLDAVGRMHGERDRVTPGAPPFRVLRAALGTLELLGELDLTGVSALDDALSAVTGETRFPRIELAGLTFIDRRGAEALYRPVSDHRVERIVLRNPRPLVRRVLHLFGIDRDPRVVLEGT